MFSFGADTVYQSILKVRLGYWPEVGGNVEFYFLQSFMSS